MQLSPNYRRSLGIISVAGHKLLVFFLLVSPKIHPRPFFHFLPECKSPLTVLHIAKARKARYNNNMPTVLNEKGYRFFFFSNEGNC